LNLVRVFISRFIRYEARSFSGSLPSAFFSFSRLPQMFQSNEELGKGTILFFRYRSLSSRTLCLHNIEFVFSFFFREKKPKPSHPSRDHRFDMVMKDNFHLRRFVLLPYTRADERCTLEKSHTNDTKKKKQQQQQQRKITTSFSTHGEQRSSRPAGGRGLPER
jgi:hypothetical protein